MAKKKKGSGRVKQIHTIYKDADELSDKINAYFDECDAEGRVYDEAGLCLYLGVSKDTLHNWYDGKTRADEPGFSTLAKNAFLLIEDQIHSDPIYRDKGMQGRAVFLMKQARLSGYVDKVEQRGDIAVTVKYGNNVDQSDFE